VLGVDISGRYFAYHGGNNLFNPVLLQSGFAPFSRPSFQAMRTQNQTIGVRVSLAPAVWWRNELAAGIDRYSYDLAQDRPRHTSPSDTLLLASDHVESRTSVGLTSSARSPLGSGIEGSLTIGANYWIRPVSDWFAVNAVTTSGAIATGAGGVITATRTETRNTGYFAQAQLELRETVFLTAGLRAEENSEFGDSLGTPLLPRVGVTFARDVRGATVKVRSSWGRAIRAPSPGRKLGYVSPTGIQVPNPLLGPERQQGWDAGFDLAFAGGGTLSFTYYRQIADDLADAVVLATAPVLTQQFQNVGQVSNSGLEAEAGMNVGVFAFRAQYGFVRSRIRRLSPTYAGDLQAGDEPLLTPAHTAGASVSYAGLPRLTITAGATYVGPWTNYDYVALFRCVGGTGACRANFRDYQISYPDMLKLSLGVTRQLAPRVTGFVVLENLTNSDAFEANNLLPVRGRTSTVGLRYQ
jgi:outer membrane receptor protein involved in Fe transport